MFNTPVWLHGASDELLKEFVTAIENMKNSNDFEDYRKVVNILSTWYNEKPIHEGYKEFCKDVYKEVARRWVGEV